MQAQNMRLREQAGQRFRSVNPVRSLPPIGNIGVIEKHIHAERLCAVARGCADSPHAHHAKGPSP